MVASSWAHSSWSSAFLHRYTLLLDQSLYVWNFGLNLEGCEHLFDKFSLGFKCYSHVHDDVLVFHVGRRVLPPAPVPAALWYITFRSPDDLLHARTYMIISVASSFILCHNYCMFLLIHQLPTSPRWRSSRPSWGSTA